MKRSLVVAHIFLILLLSSNSVKGVGFYLEGFEFETSLEERGYIIKNENNPTMRAETSKIAASNGERGLWVKSQLDSLFIEVIIPLDVNFEQLVYFSFNIFLLSNSATIRIELYDGEKIMSLDYGQNGTSWEDSPIFNVDSEFQFNEWQIINRNLDEDIEIALNHPDNPFSIFKPISINSIKIIQDNNGTNELYLDDIEINYFGNTELLNLEDQLNKNDDFPLPIAFNFVIFAFGILIILVKKVRKT